MANRTDDDGQGLRRETVLDPPFTLSGEPELLLKMSVTSWSCSTPGRSFLTIDLSADHLLNLSRIGPTPGRWKYKCGHEVRQNLEGCRHHPVVWGLVHRCKWSLLRRLCRSVTASTSNRLASPHVPDRGHVTQPRRSARFGLPHQPPPIITDPNRFGYHARGRISLGSGGKYDNTTHPAVLPTFRSLRSSTRASTRGPR
jgi:hypothetical protein